MSVITPKQCRAARELLGWTQKKLSVATGLAPSTIVNFEDEKKEKSLRSDSIELIRVAFERAGIEFLDGQGVKLRCDNGRTYRGSNSCNNFFDDMLKEMGVNGSDILVFIKTHDILTKYSGEPNRYNNFERLMRLHDLVDVKCLIADPPRAPELLEPCFEMRSVPKTVINPFSFFIYADKLAFIYLDDCLDLTVTTVHEASMVQGYKSVFKIYWDGATPIQKSKASSATKRYVEISAFA